MSLISFGALKFGSALINNKLLNDLYRKDKGVALVVVSALNIALGYVVFNNMILVE